MYRAGTGRSGQMEIALFAAIFWSALILALAFFAAFRRVSWGRWGLLLVFVIQQMVPLGTAAYFHHLDQYIGIFLKSLPFSLAMPALLLTAIGFAFTGNARGWFRTAPQPSGPTAPVPSAGHWCSLNFSPDCGEPGPGLRFHAWQQRG